MIEVFKTTVTEHVHAMMLIDMIHKTFVEYRANFDLQDCDHILRVISSTNTIQAENVINLLKEFGFEGSVLPDDYQPENKMLLPEVNTTRFQGS